MTKPALLITVRLPEPVKARAAQAFEARFDTTDVLRTGSAIADLAHGMDAILTSTIERLDAATIAALPDSVRAIATFSAGYDHIDIAAARARGIKVCNTPDVLSVATAEIGMLLILGAARRVGEAERLLRAGEWKGWSPDLMIGMQLSGKRLGILGMGSIGRHLARMARGFGMEIHYRNRNRLAPELEQGAIHHASDDSFLPICDVLSLNAPGGAATRHWLNAERIARLPRGVVVVNTGRGSLVDDTALVAALKTGHVGYVGLDVFDGEPNFNQGYLELPNALLLPHMGSSTREAREAMGMYALDGIEAVLAGRTPPNLVK
jgi:lactate dehydrogenase-like 2-hydroxyacid dehydrogenase